MTASNYVKAAGVLLAVAGGLLLRAGGPGTPAFALAPVLQSDAVKSHGVPADEYDRNAQLWAMQRTGYKSGWQRGQEIYYMECWMCHNEYTIVADTTPSAPSLRNLYKQGKLANGQPVTDEAVAARIRGGSARMPAYTAAVLSDADIADLLAYLREKCGTFPTGGGCFDEHNPPPNPRYRAK